MLEITIAFLLDLTLGDPPYSWHPVRIIGRIIERTEAWLRAHIPEERAAGFIQAIGLPLITFGVVWFICELAGQIHSGLKTLLEVFFLYSALSVKDLEIEARGIYTCLVNKKIENARENLARIVGRDTSDLEESEIIRATVEAVAESFVDGILSPLFYAAIGGAPLAMAYKTVNTLDSMVGHKTSKYKEYGRMAARMDEWWNWIPARISWILIGVGAFFLNGRNTEAWRIGFEDGASNRKTNSVVPEAAFAGALGVELGGVNYYQGVKKEMPKLGYPMRALEKEDIRRAYRLMKYSAWTALGFALILSYISWFFYIKIFDPIAL